MSLKLYVYACMWVGGWVCMWQRVCVGGYYNKTPDRNDLKLGTAVVLDTIAAY